jgi:hypothetical protein
LPGLRAEIGLRRFGPFIGILDPVLHPALLLVPLLIQGAPEGFKSAESKVRGISLIIPATFDEIPIPPGERNLLMKFAEKGGDDKRDAVGAEMWIVEIEKPPAATVDSDAATLKPDSSPASRAAKPKPEFRTLPEYVKRALRGFEANADGTLELGAGKHYDRYKLSASEPKASGVGYALDDGDRWVCFIGIAGNLRFDDLQKKYERSAKSLRAKDGIEAVSSDIELLYRMRPYRGVEYRKDVRRNLSKGWKADDTENFIFVYDIADRVLLSKLKHDLEVIRTKYLELFPPVKAIEAVSTVRICKDRDEFVKFAGIPKNAPIAGFWNVGTKELVFYNNVKDPTYPSASLADSVIVLYHEAFHQYIYYSCGEIAPHSWFNEGYGDYFSGAKIGDTGAKVDRINVNPWRIGAIQRAIKASEIAPLAELVKFTQAQYYAKGGVYYPEGWSLIFFLNESKVAKKNPAWAKILPTYFATLITRYQAGLEKLGPNPNPNLVGAEQLAAQKAAVEAAFENVDFDKLQAAWKDFVMSLDDPRAKK